MHKQLGPLGHSARPPHRWVLVHTGVVASLLGALIDDLVEGVLRRYWFPVASVASGLACHATYNAIGSYVADDGTLVEPFALIPVGFLFMPSPFCPRWLQRLHLIDHRQIPNRIGKRAVGTSNAVIGLGLFSFAVGVFLYWVVVD